jgi:hypothetical protein
MFLLLAAPLLSLPDPSRFVCDWGSPSALAVPGGLFCRLRETASHPSDCANRAKRNEESKDGRERNRQV